MCACWEQGHASLPCAPAWAEIKILQCAGASSKGSHVLQANTTIPIVQQNMDTPSKLGAIFYNSMRQNQSFAVAGKPAFHMIPEHSLLTLTIFM